MYKLLFVCMGNICRSPSAEGFFTRHLEQSGQELPIEADSAGTHSYHIGAAPDSRAVSAAARFGVDLSALRARKIREEDFRHFDLIVAMDEDNHEILRRMRESAAPGEAVADLCLMMEFSPRFPGAREVPDPYYGGQHDFAYMCELLDEATRGLLTEIERRTADGEALGRGG